MGPGRFKISVRTQNRGESDTLQGLSSLIEHKKVTENGIDCSMRYAQTL